MKLNTKNTKKAYLKTRERDKELSNRIVYKNLTQETAQLNLETVQSIVPNYLKQQKHNLEAEFMTIFGGIFNSYIIPEHQKTFKLSIGSKSLGGAS